MTADDIDIEALLDAPLKAAIKPTTTVPSTVDDVIGTAKNESSRHRHRDDRDYRDHRDSRDHRESRNDRDYREHREHREYRHDREHRDERRDRRERSPPRDRDRRHYEAGPSRSSSVSHVPVTPQMPLTEAERDRRTVFCRQLAQCVRSDDLRTFFSAAGAVHDVRLVYDRVSNRSKGVAYVEFAEAASVQKAIGMTGQKLSGIPVIVELTETEKNRLAEEAAESAKRSKPSTNTSGSGGYNGPVGIVSFSKITKVFVGGLHPSLDEAALRRVFEPFGDVELVDILRGPTNEPNGTAHIQNASDAGMAVDQMNGFTLAGRPIRVGILRDRPDGTNAVQYKVGEVFSSNLDDAETQGLSLNAKTRAELMMKLARDPISAPGVPGGPSPFILLSGMYDPDEETELGWEYAITDEVRDECTRFGPITHISVAKSKDGQVWIKFATIQSAQSAINELNGRWFGGRQIKAVFVDQGEYHRRFSILS